MQFKKYAFFVFLLFIFSFADAQTLPYEKYTSKNGLLSDRITAIAQDHEGFMWFGSYFGLCRYDGLKFEKIPLPPAQQNRFVTFITPVGKKVYAGFLFNGGLAEYENGKARFHFINGGKGSSNDFTCMVGNPDGSALVCNASNEVYEFSSGRFKYLQKINQPLGLYPTSLLKDRWNNLWIGTGQGLFISFYPYTSAHKYFSGQGIASLSKDKDGRMWILTTGRFKNTLLFCDGFKDGRFQNLQTVDSLNPVAVPFSGNIHKGLWFVDPSKSVVNISSSSSPVRYKVPVDLNTDISTVFCDRENNLWIANEPGVIKLSNFNAQSYLFDELAVGGGSLCQQDDSLLLVCSSKSIFSVRTAIQKQFFEAQRTSLYGAVFVDSKKNVWVSLWDGGIWLAKWKNGRLVRQKFFLRFDHSIIKTQKIIEDKEGNIWIGGVNGLFRFRNEQPVDHCQPSNAMGNPAFITALSLDEQNHVLWLGDNTSGIIKLRYSIKNGTGKYLTERYITDKDGLKDMFVRSLFFDQRKNLWIGTRYGGISRIKENAGKLFMEDPTSVAKLTCTRITDIASNDSSLIWFASCDGIYSYQYNQNEWHHYKASDGLLNAEVFNVLPDIKNDCVWALTSQGVTKIYLKNKETGVAPLVDITSIAILGKNDSSVLSSLHPHTYSSSENSIGFSFIAPSFIDEKKVRYRYKLEGYDKDWSEPVLTNSVNYASLPPGKYVFKVVAANAKEQWSKQPAVFAFEITMPFYKRSWFLFLLIITAFSIAYFIRFQQLKNRYKIEKLRLSIARDLHDDVGATLGSINILSKTATRKLEKQSEPAEIHSIFQKIGTSAENTMEAMDDIVWSINPDKDKLQDLVIRMREYAIPLLEAKNIGFSFKTDGDLSVSISMNLRRNLFLIFKESIHNILKHSDASYVFLFLGIKNQGIQFGVSDNGKGFDINCYTSRNGVKNMQQRAQSIGALLKIQSSEKGTEINFSSSLR